MLANSAIITRTINTLTALTTHGLKFRVELPDGKSYGNLRVEQKKPRKQIRPFGSVKSILDGFLKDLPAGELVQIPIPDGFRQEDFRGRVCCYCIEHWGKKTYTTSANKEYVEVLRVS